MQSCVFIPISKTEHCIKLNKGIDRGREGSIRPLIAFEVLNFTKKLLFVSLQKSLLEKWIIFYNRSSAICNSSKCTKCRTIRDCISLVDHFFTNDGS